MGDAGLKYDIVFGFKPQFIIKSRHFFAPEDIIVTVRAVFSLNSKEN